MTACLEDVPSAHNWASVCGFPAEKRRRRLLHMLKAYIDESEEGGMFVIAGYISTAERWAAFSDDWRNVLDTNSPHYKRLDAYKSSLMRVGSQVDMEQSGWFYNAIEDHALAAISVHFPISALRNALHRLPRRAQIAGIEKLENPYYFSFRAIIDLLLQNQKNLGFNTPIDFIFDEKSEKIPCIEGWERMKGGATGERLSPMGDTPTFKKDDEVLPLQAADLWAAWVRRWANSPTGISGALQNLSFPWKAKRLDLPRLAFWYDEQGIYDNLVRIFDAEFFAVGRQSLKSYKRKYGWIC